MSLSFTKETVGSAAPPSGIGLLASSLFAPGSRGTTPSGSPRHLTEATTASVKSARSPMPAASAMGGLRESKSYSRNALPAFTVAQTIAGIVNTYHSEIVGSGEDGTSWDLGIGSDAARYDLRIAEDDGSVDPDFPSIDFAVPITSIGVDKFVLCDIATDKPVMRVCIPAQAVQLRVCEADDAPVELLITCYQPLAAPTSTRAIGVIGALPRVPPPSSSPEAAGAAAVDTLASTLATASLASPPKGVPRENSAMGLGGKHFTVRLRGLPAA